MSTRLAKSLHRPALGTVIYLGVAMSLSLYFTFAAVQGDFGLFRRIEIEAEQRILRTEHEALVAQVAQMQNKTRRLSDASLDLDLLDQQARDVLGLLRADEIVVQ